MKKADTDSLKLFKYSLKNEVITITSVMMNTILAFENTILIIMRYLKYIHCSISTKDWYNNWFGQW